MRFGESVIGCCEDSTVPALVRDAHVLPIWEGTTDVLALDALRAAAGGDALAALLADARERAMRAAAAPAVAAPAAAVAAAAARVERAYAEAPDAASAEARARALALGLARVVACAQLCAQGAWAAAGGDGRTARAAGRLAQRGLAPEDGPPPLELAEP
jgi:hypothetical protein